MGISRTNLGKITIEKTLFLIIKKISVSEKNMLEIK